MNYAENEARQFEAALMNSNFKCKLVMRDGKWKTGLLGVFTIDEYNGRLSIMKGEVHEDVWKWYDNKKSMFFESASAKAKLMAGHLRQFSTNNISENFNRAIKVTIGKQLTLDKLIVKLNERCEESLNECFWSTVGHSEYVIVSVDLQTMSMDEKLQWFADAGITGGMLPALDVPYQLLSEVNLERSRQEAEPSGEIDIYQRDTDIFNLRDDSGTGPKYASVELTQGMLICNKCNSEKLDFICRHVLRCLKDLSDTDRMIQWHKMLTFIKKQKKEEALQSQGPRIDPKSGMKLSDRIGKKNSANNRKRKMVEVSTLTVYKDDPKSNGQDDSANSRTTLTESENEVNFDNETTSLFSPQSTFTPIFSSTRLEERQLVERELKDNHAEEIQLDADKADESQLNDSRRSARNRTSSTIFDPSPTQPNDDFEMSPSHRLLRFDEIIDLWDIELYTNTTESLTFPATLGTENNYSVRPDTGTVLKSRILKIRLLNDDAPNDVLTVFYKTKGALREKSFNIELRNEVEL